MNQVFLNVLSLVIDQVLQLGGLAFRCVELEWNQHEKRLRIYIAKKTLDSLGQVPEQGDENGPGGVDVDDCAKVSRLLSEAYLLDELIKGTYHLEVSSPGVEPPLRRNVDFLSVCGAEVAIRLVPGVAGNKARTFERVVCDVQKTGKSSVLTNEKELDAALSKLRYGLEQAQKVVMTSLEGVKTADTETTSPHLDVEKGFETVSMSHLYESVCSYVDDGLISDYVDLFGGTIVVKGEPMEKVGNEVSLSQVHSAKLLYDWNA